MYSYIFLILSIVLSVCKSGIYNKFAKSENPGITEILSFNALSYGMVTALTLLLDGFGKISLITLVCAAAYAIDVFSLQAISIAAMKIGPMSLTTMFVLYGMIIPSLSGPVFWGEPFGAAQAVGVVLILLSVWLLCEPDGTRNAMGHKWIAMAAICLLLSGMAGATGYEGIGGFPMAFTDFANLDVLGLPVPLIIFLICLLVFWLWLHKTHAGRNVFLIGQSPRVALYSAIPVNRTLCALYAMTGLASAVAAVLLVSYFGSARSDLGASFLMPAITAVVLGGANIYGGSGSIIGTAIAVLLVGYLQQGLQMAGVPNQVSSALSGALLIVVVVGRSVSLHRQQIKEWLARRANNPLP